MDEWPDVVSGQVGISAYAWTAFERDTYHPVASSVHLCGVQDVQGLSGLKVG